MLLYYRYVTFTATWRWVILNHGETSVIVRSVLLLQWDNTKMLSYNHAKLVIRASARKTLPISSKTFLFCEANSVFLQRNLISFTSIVRKVHELNQRPWWFHFRFLNPSNTTSTRRNLQNRRTAQLVKKFPAFYGTKCSLPCSQKPVPNTSISHFRAIIYM
jgi:hypothetical protein